MSDKPTKVDPMAHDETQAASTPEPAAVPPPGPDRTQAIHRILGRSFDRHEAGYRFLAER